ncbi:MAG: mechanosensitive ion channel family protein [Alphaproteobacteria bacterium]
MPEIPENLLSEFLPMAVDYTLRVLGALLVLVIGWIVAGSLSRGVRRALANQRRIDPILQGIFSSAVKYLLLALVVMAVLNQFGIETTGLVALIGAFGLAIGLALQGALSTMAAGVMLVAFRPFRIGHYIEVGGHAGTVEEVTLLTTELSTPDNVQIILPNNAVWGQAIVNYSYHPRRRVDFTLVIAHRDDIGGAMDIIEGALRDDTRCLEDPEPQIVVSNIEAAGISLTVRVWVEAADYWPVKFDLNRAFKERFERNGVTFARPQHDIHLAGQALSLVQGAA